MRGGVLQALAHAGLVGPVEAIARVLHERRGFRAGRVEERVGLRARLREHAVALVRDGRGDRGGVGEPREVGGADQAVVEADSARSMGEPNSHACSGK